MKKRKKWMAAVLALALGTSMLAGCGKDSGDKSDVKADAGSNGAKQVVTVGANSDWGDISPFGTMSQTRSAVMYNFYEYMAVRKDFGAALEDMEKECAKEITQVDELTYEIEMYDNIKDSEGNAITAEDYAWAAATMKEKGNYEKLNSYLDSVTATGDYTVQLKLTDNPLGAIEYMMNIIPVISQKAYEESVDEMATKPVTTGPYIVESLVPGATLTLVKNENYWQTEESQKHALAGQNVDKIVYSLITEPSQMSTALQTGSIDLAQYMDNTALDTFYKDGKATEGYEAYTLNSNVMFSVLPNCSDKSVVGESADLRKALYTAIDADAVLQAMCNGLGTRLNAMANPISGDYVEAWDEAAYYPYDPDEAKAMMEKAGYKPEELKLTLLTLPMLDKAAQVIQANLSEIGVTVEIASYEDALYQTYKLDDSQWDIMLDIKGTDDFVTFPWSLLFDNRSFEGKTANFIVDEDLQSKIEAAISTDTHGEDTVKAVQEALNENGYCYGLYTTNNYIIGKSGAVSEMDYIQNAFVLPGCCTY